MTALERLESKKGTQEDVNQKTNALIEKKDALQLLVEIEKVNPSSSNKDSLYQIYRADGTKDSGNRDGEGGDQWQVRESQIDATIPGAYAEFKGNYVSFIINGANKYDSSDFKVVITDDATGNVIAEDQIKQSKDAGSNTVQIYSKEGLSGEPQTVRVYHTGTEGQYLELREIQYTAIKENAEKIPSLEKIKVTKLPDTVKYEEGFEGEIEFVKALEEARAVLEEENATQNAVDAACRNLEKAMGSLELKADKTKLEHILEELKGIDFTKYTKESVEAFDKVLVKANKVMSDESLSVKDQEKVNDMVKQLEEAKKNLKLKAPDTDTEDSDHAGSKPDNKDDGNQNDSKNESHAVKTGDQGNILMQGILVLFAAWSVALLMKKRYNK